MARYSSTEVAERMEAERVIPLFFHSDFEVVKNVVKSCYNAGSRILEFTNRGENAYTIFTDLVAFAQQNFPDMLIGSGSIMDAETTVSFLESGADFIVSPILDKEMAHVCNDHDILWSPGCGTLTEVHRANKLGAKIVKLFPGSHLQPAFIKAVRGPCPWLKLMPTGGVSPENLSDWFDAGATCVGMGSKLIRKDFLQEKRFKDLSNHIAEILHHARSLNNAT